MADQTAIQEAIKMARELAARMKKNPAKRTASDLDDAVGTVKVTLAYEKPANSDNVANNQQQSRNSRGFNNNNNDSSNNKNNNSSRSGGGGHHGHHSKERDRDDRDSGYSGGASTTNSNNYQNENLGGNNQPPSLLRAGNYDAPLSGANAFPRGAVEDKIEIIIPHAVIGLVIGKGGENIKRIQNESGAIVRVDPNTVDEKGNKVCTITGTKQAVEQAHAQVANVIENAGTSKRPRMQVEGSEQYKMIIPASRTGAIIGKGGETIKQIKQQSNCDIELDKNAKECAPDESLFIIRGSQENIQIAKSLIETRLASRGRDGDRDRDRGRERDRDRDSSHLSRGLATGANAAPVAPISQFPTMPNATAYPNHAAAGVGLQGNPDVSAAWAAYYAQYSSLLNQQGAVPHVDGVAAPQSEQPQAVAAPAAAAAVSQAPQAGDGQQDYSDQWIEYYMSNGRPDYAQQIIEMKKQRQQQQPPLL